MDLEQAAAFLGVSTRMVEKYAAKGLLSKRKIRTGKTLKNAYSQGELIALKAKLHTETITPQVMAIGTPRTDSEHSEAALVSQQSEPLRTDLSPMVTVAERLVAELAALKSAVESSRETAVPLADKLTLTISEAAALSGLSPARIRDGIRAGQLKVVGAGRGRRIRRTDLENYVNRMWDEPAAPGKAGRKSVAGRKGKRQG